MVASGLNLDCIQTVRVEDLVYIRAVHSQNMVRSNDADGMDMVGTRMRTRWEGQRGSEDVSHILYLPFPF